MTNNAVGRAHDGRLEGMQLAGLVRMSHELPDLIAEATTDEARSQLPMAGTDIKGRMVQAGDCEGFTTRRGGTYVYTYEEPDTSAWKRTRVIQDDGTVVWRVIRPVFEKALNDLKRGFTPDGKRLDGLVVYDLDRLTRDNRSLEDAIDVVTHYDRPILDTTNTIDLLTDNGRSMARVLVTMSNKQSADTARRVARKHQAMQQAGIPAGGPRPFGWNDDRRTLRVDEAEEIREAAKAILYGVPVTTIANNWNERGIPSVLGGRWRADSLIRLFRNPRICGYRSRHVVAYNAETESGVRHVEIVRDVDGNPVIGQWRPILTVAKWEQVVEMVGDRNKTIRGKNARTYFLTGILRCGRCGTKLRPSKSSTPLKDGSQNFSYTCASKGSGGCGGMSISGPNTDVHIIELVIQKYEMEESKRRESAAETGGEEQEWEGAKSLIKVRKDKKDLFDYWQLPEDDPRHLPSGDYFAMRPELERKERELAAEHRAWIARVNAASSRPTDIRTEWESYTLAQKRGYAEDVLTAIVIHAANGRKRQYSERIEPIWKEATA